jgi:putative oxidoreductase
MYKLYETFKEKLELLKDFPPLFFRLILAYGFYNPAMQKWSNINGVAEWFGSMNYPAPLFNAYMAAGTETIGFILLALGLFTRLISIPLMFIMIVAITTVHMGNGFEAGSNGIEIPFYYFLMLFSLLVNGPGRISLDTMVKKYFQNK